MQQIEQMSELGQEDQQRVDKVVETLATLANRGENVTEVAHDARNMLTALDLYCDLLQEPGVLSEPFSHYGGELRLVAAASRRLVDKLTGLRFGGSEVQAASAIDQDGPGHPSETLTRGWKNVPLETIKNLAEEVLANRSLLAALAGPTIAVTVDAQGGCLPVRITSEDLTRILVNLVKNAAEAMSAVGRIHISLWESCGEEVGSRWLTLNIEDNGPGLPEKVVEGIFEARQVSQHADSTGAAGWPIAHRGLGLSITRSIVEAAGGMLHAANRDPSGACFQIELPVQL